MEGRYPEEEQVSSETHEQDASQGIAESDRQRQGRRHFLKRLGQAGALGALAHFTLLGGTGRQKALALEVDCTEPAKDGGCPLSTAGNDNCNDWGCVFDDHPDTCDVSTPTTDAATDECSASPDQCPLTSASNDNCLAEADANHGGDTCAEGAPATGETGDVCNGMKRPTVGEGDECNVYPYQAWNGDECYGNITGSDRCDYGQDSVS